MSSDIDKPCSIASSSFSPPCKKMKIDRINIVPILDANITSQEIKLRNVFTAELNDKRDASKLQKILPPLPSNLEHLKRIRSKQGVLEIIIGEDRLPFDDPILNLFACVRETQVPKQRPLSSFQFKKANDLWPCNFHPDKDIEKLLQENCGFNQEDVNIISNNINAVVRRLEETGKQSCAIYDPVDKELVCIANSSPHVLQHSVMNSLNMLAKLQNESENKKENFSIAENDYGKVICQRTLRNKNSDYLCTGMDIFMSHEPCTMCAMALLHSRARRIFFANVNNRNGSLMSIVKLHCLEGINHRFQVFNVM